jgi:adenosylhomocysteinase
VANPKGTPVFAWKGETLEEYWWCTSEALEWPDGGGPTLIVDDGGDATLVVHKGAEFEKYGAVPEFKPESDPEEWGVILDCINKSIARDKGRWTRLAKNIRGVSEETTTGVPPLSGDGSRHAALPRDQRQRLVTKSKFDNIYGCRHSLPDGLARATGVMLGGKVAVVFGFRRSRQGLRQALCGQGRVIVTEIDPICALQAAMEGYEVNARERHRARRHLHHRHRQLQHHHRAGHGADEGQGDRQHRPLRQRIDMAGLKKHPGVERSTSSRVRRVPVRVDSHSVMVLAEATAAESGLRYRS